MNYHSSLKKAGGKVTARRLSVAPFFSRKARKHHPRNHPGKRGLLGASPEKTAENVQHPKLP